MEMLLNKSIYKTSNFQTLSREQSELKNCLLECFDTVSRGNRLQLNMTKLLHIITNDLNIIVKNISTPMKGILSECLCYYMKIWPGWKAYRAKCLDLKAKENYQLEFKEYLILKIKYIIDNETTFDTPCNSDGDKAMERLSQVNSIDGISKPEAPYSLVISGKPYFLSNLAFVESRNNIVIQPHTGRPWKSLSMKQFLNYPFIQVHVKLPDLELTRQNSHLFTRHISNYEDNIDIPQTSFIDFVRKNDTDDKVNVYAVDFIITYCKQFIEVIKSQYTISKCKIIELEMIFKEFLCDIKESNIQQSFLSTGKMVNTMATNVTVCFNIGGRTYVRHKKMCVTSDHNNTGHGNVLIFKESLIPKTMFSLNKFIAEQDHKTSDISFKSLNEMVNKFNQNYQERITFNEIIHNSVTYKCLLCLLTYAGKEAYNEILEHFSIVHRGEQTVVCCKCQREFDIAHLAGCRWTHDCKKQNGTVTKSAPLNLNVDVNFHSNVDAVAQKNYHHNLPLDEDLIKNNFNVRSDIQMCDSLSIKGRITDEMACSTLKSVPFVTLPVYSSALNLNALDNLEVSSTSSKVPTNYF